MSALLSRIGWALHDGHVVALRNIILIRRVPEVLAGVLVAPIMFVLLFAYVFGSSIPIEGLSYREFLIGGIFAQTVVFGATFTGAGLAQDVRKGIMDRFRSLPMEPAAVLIGRTASDVIYNVMTVVVMSLAGLAVGWRIRSSLLDALGGFLILLLFAYALSWVMAYLGLLVPKPEVINNASFVVIFPLTFVANTFVPAENLPGPLRTLAGWNPVSAVTEAARRAFGNTSPLAPTPDVWPLEHPVAYTLIWVAVLLVVFVPLSTRQLRRAALR